MDWLERQLGQAAPQIVETTSGHGRIEQREYWWCASGELEAYLAAEYGWSGVQVCGRVRRKRRSLHADTWEEVEEHVLIYGSRWPKLPSAAQCSDWLRRHWEIENRVFWVLDVTYNEDRNHARQIAPALNILRCTVLNIIRQRGFRYIPDGQRAAAALADRGLAWLC